jgi:hypothetical protein
VRLAEAEALMNLGHADGAYYLAGYAVECGLKACIAQETQRGRSLRGDPQFQKHWDVVQSWSEQSRYTKNSRESAKALIEAIVDRNHGVMKWVKRSR